MNDIRRVGVGPRMSQAVVCNGVAYLAGQIAVDQAGAPVSEQTREILDRTDALLAALGTDKSRILSAPSIWQTSLRSSR